MLTGAFSIGLVEITGWCVDMIQHFSVATIMAWIHHPTNLTVWLGIDLTNDAHTDVAASMKRWKLVTIDAENMT